MTNAVKKQPLLSGLLILFLTAMIFANMGGNMFGGLMPLYLKDLKASIPQIGLFFTLAQIVPLMLQILGGWVSDSLGRLRAIAIGSVFGVIGFIPLVMADTWQWLLLAAAVGSVARALVIQVSTRSLRNIPPKRIAARSTASRRRSSRIVTVVGSSSWRMAGSFDSSSCS
ncbi:MAG: MFS transporter [Anaerolineales bacterium]